MPYCPCLIEMDRDILPCVADNGSTDTGSECFNISFGIRDFSIFIDKI